MEILIPIWQEDQETRIATSRVKALAGASVALVDDNFDAIFTDEVERILSEEHGANVRRFLKPLGSAPAPNEMIEQAAQCQLAVVGIGL